MRTQYRRRSWTSHADLDHRLCCDCRRRGLAVSLVADVGCGFRGDSGPIWIIPRRKDSQAPSARPNHEQPANDASSQGQDIFAAQTEPEVPDLPEDVPPFAPAEPPDFSDFPSPPKLLPANPDAKPIPVPSRLVQTVEGELPPPNHLRPRCRTKSRPAAGIQLLNDEAPAPPKPRRPNCPPV